MSDNSEFDVGKFIDSMDATFDDFDDLGLSDEAKADIAKRAAELEAMNEDEDEDPEIDDDPPWLERQEMEDFEQADEYFGEFPI